MKKTKTRESILNLLRNTSSPMSANDIFKALKSKDITLSSVYRTLDTFYKENMLIKDLDQNGTAIYTIHKDNHHHYLQCKECNKKIDLDFCPYHKINTEINKQFGFIVDEKNLVIYGICNDCSNKK